jgi:peptide/nickel transport system substrate-binding protein
MSGASAPSGTITFAEGAAATPNYILPYLSPQFCSEANSADFEYLMYRPLYWFGLGSSVALQPQLSLAKLPTFSNGSKTVTINTKGWKFADGQTINAESVVFFLNMYKADPTGLCYYVPNYGIPDQVASVTGHGNTVKITFTVPVNHNWITYNYLSEITPMPNSWDRTAAHKTSNCASGRYGASSTDVACKNVEAYLVKQSSNTSTFTDAMWQGGDTGPWKLTSLDNLGNATFRPNTKYSGPQKAQVQYFKEVAFTTQQAEENQLQAGTIDWGFVDPSILTSPATAPGKAGPNWSPLVGRYKLVAGPIWSTNYDLINFKGNTDAAEMAQTYVRAALEQAINQPGIIANAWKDYAFTDISALPTSVPASMSGPITNHYPFSRSAAEGQFTSHGWTNSGGQLTCTSAGSGSSQCGAGIASGTKMDVSFEWVSGSNSEDAQNNAIVSAWQSLGITVTQSEGTFDSVISSCPGSSNDICSWGGGGGYSPDYYPTGESLYAPGAAANYGSYVDPTGQMGNLIHATAYTNVKLTAYAQYTADQLPVLYVPNPSFAVEYSTSLKSSISFTPNPLLTITPEYFHY